MTDDETKYRAIAKSLLGALRTMGDATLEIRAIADGFKVDVSGTYYTSAECDRHIANLALAIHYAPAPHHNED